MGPMDEIITIVNNLHDTMAELKLDLKLDLPQIAVIGSQSSGKSSVLENVVGKDFLPRGSGIVTKCPLVLQLTQTEKGSAEYAEFLHKPKKHYTDFTKVREEIEARTIEMVGSSGSVTSSPINLKIFSPHVLTLTLVDLPGLVMNAVGDQPRDIDRQIKEMVTNYVRPANTIMLAVSPANADMATSAALRLAKQIDPDGERTVGVLTKLDLVDKGCDAMDMLEGKQIPLRLGYIGVVNRSQQDINQQKDIMAARKSEQEYFESHPTYSSVADRHGTAYLSKFLNKILLRHIQKSLPELKVHIEKLSMSTRKQQEQLGMLDECTMEPSAQLLALIKGFSDNVNMSIEGEAIEGAKELVGGARLDYIYHECFTPFVMKLQSGKELTDEYIQLTIRNRCGMQSTLFPSDQVFITLAKQQIKRLEDPAVKCVTFIYDELIKIVEACCIKVDRFPTLRRRFVEISQEMLQQYRVPTVGHVKTTIQAEAGYINIKHPQMVDAAQHILGNAQQLGPDGQPVPQATSTPSAISRSTNMNEVPRNIHVGGSMTDTAIRQNAQIRDMVTAYFSITQRNVADQVPKIITLLMIAKLREELYPRLIQELYNENLYKELLSENTDVASKRKATKQMMLCLKKAGDVLGKVRDVIIN